jgi:hypothetical protein
VTLLPQGNKIELQLKALTGGSDNRAENVQIPDLQHYIRASTGHAHATIVLHALYAGKGDQAGAVQAPAAARPPPRQTGVPGP